MRKEGNTVTGIEQDDDRISNIIGNLRLIQMTMKQMDPDEIRRICETVTNEKVPQERVVEHTQMRAELLNQAIEILEAYHRDALKTVHDSAD